MKLFRIFILVFFAVTIVACGGAEERKAVYLEKAKVSMEAGDLDKARIELKNVLQIDPKDGDAYYQLGKVYEQKKEYRKAYGSYLKAEELNPENLSNQARLGRIYLLMANQPEKAQEKIDYILSKDSNNADGLLLKALMVYREKDIPEAMKIVESVVAREPGNVEGVALLAALYTKDNRLDDAITILNDAAKVNPDDVQLNKLLALALVKNKDYERAESIYKKFLEKKPDSAESYNDLASFYIQSGNKSQAEKTFRLSIENAPDDVDRVLALVRYIKLVKGSSGAITELKVLVNKNPDFGELRKALAELLYLDGDEKAAINTYNQAINDFSEEETGVESRIALASIYFNKKNYVKASEIINDAMAVSPNDPKVNYLKARLALQNKNYEQAIISLRIVTKEVPENIEAYLLLANVYKLEGNEEQFNNTLNSAYDNNRTNPAGLLTLAQYYMRSDVKKAEKIIDSYNAIKVTDYAGLSIKTAILNKNKVYAEALKLSKILMKSFPDKPNGYLQSAPYYDSEKNIGEAISVLKKGYSNVKDNRKILILLTTLETSQKDYESAKKRIQAELKASPDDVDLNVLLAKVYLADNELDNATRVLNELIKDKPNSEEPYLLLAQIHMNKKDLTSLESTLKDGIENVAKSIQIPLRLAGLYEHEKKYRQAIDVYRSMNESFPDNLLIMNNLASILSDHGNGKDDLNLAKSFIEKLKDSGQPVFLDTIGWVYYHSADYENAIKYLLQVVEKSPDINIFNYHLGMAYKMSGNKDTAKVYLEKSLANGKKFREKDLAKAALKDL